jgi:peptidoglycan DL-endopeptidase CwlO
VRTRRFIALLAVAATAAATGSAASARPPSAAIQAQRAHEQAVLAEIGRIGVNLEQVVQAYDGARIRLATVERSLRINTIALGVARQNLHASQQRVAQRLVSLYVDGQPGLLDVLAGAKSLTDMIDRLEESHMLSTQDAALGTATLHFATSVRQREALLKRQRRERTATVARLQARRQTIEAALAEQRRLLASIHRTIQGIQAREAARQRQLAELARERIARALAARQQQAVLAAQQTATGSDQAPGAAPGLVASPAAPGIPTTAAGHPEAATIATRYLGVPYVWGGASPAGFDCSGLVMYVYAQLGISLPHYTVSQWNATIPISLSELEPGDLLFFDGIGHVGIYIGGGQFIHAPYTGTVVQIADLAGAMGSLDGARRVP